ncbi:MAG: hypothetical protein AWU54_291 [Candidatus Frackibacter sp. T328-2]|nr:MAG: hypothetical protein AWU54_291 [Candidatus Frackibacter sp. T328-2]
MIELVKNAELHNIHTTFLNFSPTLRGFIYPCTNGHYHIIINNRFTREMQQKVLLHETYHIKHHVPNLFYLIGLDMQRITIEKEAADAVLELITDLNRGDSEDYF